MGKQTVTLPDEEVYDAGDVEQVTKKRQTAKFIRETELTELKQVLGTVGGKKLLGRLLQQCGVYNPVETMTDEGRRRVGIWLLREIALADPEAYGRMQVELAS